MDDNIIVNCWLTPYRASQSRIELQSYTMMPATIASQTNKDMFRAMAILGIPMCDV